MNKRIKELIDQCTETFTHYVDGRGNITETYFDKEKFAELIVKDCIDAIGNIEEMFFNGRIATDDFTEKNRYAEGETACQMAKRKIEMRYEVN